MVNPIIPSWNRIWPWLLEVDSLCLSLRLRWQRLIVGYYSP